MRTTLPQVAPDRQCQTHAFNQREGMRFSVGVYARWPARTSRVGGRTLIQQRHPRVRQSLGGVGDLLRLQAVPLVAEADRGVALTA